MDLQKIRQLVNGNLTNDIVRMTILKVIAEDETALLDMMQILENERRRKKELILEMNMQLSRADMGLKNPKLNYDGFMQKEISEFYQQYRDQVLHCFKKNG